MKSRLLLLLHVLQLLSRISIVSAYTTVSNRTLRAIPRPGNDFDIKTGKLLSPILVPRVPGSEGSIKVLKHFLDFFKSELPQWNVAIQNSTSKTPVTGNEEIPFHNVIATRDPPWSSPGEVGYLTLVAHYDSLRTPEGFIGATDSAAPCAMLMHAARNLDAAMTKRWAAMDKLGLKQEDYDLGLEEHKGLQIFLLDGEEAFDVWSHKDSIYGAKSLAAEMETTYHPALSTYHNALSSIHMFLLLDLLGSPAPKVPSYYKVNRSSAEADVETYAYISPSLQTTHWAYKSMATLEARLRDQSLLASSPNHPSKRSASGQPKEQQSRRQEPTWFYDLDKSSDRWMGGLIEDDHLPFIARGVEVLHVIPSPFPAVWHKSTDDGEHLDLDTCGDWAVLVTAFAAEWMDLEGYLDLKSKTRAIIDESVISKSEL